MRSPVTLLLGLAFFTALAVPAPAKNLSPFKGTYTVQIQSTLNGAAFTGSGRATFRPTGSGGIFTVKGTTLGGLGTAFPANVTLKLSGKRAQFSDLTLGLTNTAASPGKGPLRSRPTQLTFRATGADGLALTGRATVPKGKRKGRVTLTISGSNPAFRPPVAYSAASRTVVSGGITYSYVLARPPGASGPLPLIVAFHGDGGTGAGFRTGLKLEDAVRGGAIVAYLDAVGGTFEYYTKAGRDAEAAVVTQLINDLNNAGLIRPDRVFLTGHSGGATMVNAIGFRLGPVAIRGLGIMSGSLYAVDNDLPAQMPGNPTLPPALILWGQADTSGGTEYQTSGLSTRDAYLAAYQAVNPRATSPAPTVIYAGNPADIWWCAVPGMGHAIFEKAPETLWNYFSSRL